MLKLKLLLYIANFHFETVALQTHVYGLEAV